MKIIKMRMSGHGKRPYVACFDYRTHSQLREKTERVLAADFRFRRGDGRGMDAGKIYDAICGSYSIVEIYDSKTGLKVGEHDADGVDPLDTASMAILDAAEGAACLIFEESRAKEAETARPIASK